MGHLLSENDGIECHIIETGGEESKRMTENEDVQLDENMIKCVQCKGFRRYCQRQKKMEKKQTMICQWHVMPWHKKKKNR